MTDDHLKITFNFIQNKVMPVEMDAILLTQEIGAFMRIAYYRRWFDEFAPITSAVVGALFGENQYWSLSIIDKKDRELYSSKSLKEKNPYS